MQEHYADWVQPCGKSKKFIVACDPAMNHRELLQMWKKLELMGRLQQIPLKQLVDDEDARNYSI